MLFSFCFVGFQSCSLFFMINVTEACKYVCLYIGVRRTEEGDELEREGNTWK